ncbi:MAG: hypothetical protein QOH47_2418 [Sphingomonadales bacterium]|jgi:hypothetical protein|nr:hypothetical protein [Sphingomonadales bacterium]
MAALLAQLTPRDAATDTRPYVRAASAQNRDITGLNGQTWFPAMSAMPTQTMKLFDGDFSSDVEPGQVAFTLQLGGVLDANVGRYLWAGAPVTLYRGEPGAAWPWGTWFVGKVQRWEADGTALKLTAAVNTEPFEADALTATYAGTGGAEGDANLKGKAKPWLFGRCLNVEPVLINAVDNVYQVSAYGPIQAVVALFERGEDFGASTGNYASYAALLAATIPGGGWGTCIAEGLIRLGAPAYGLITADVDGHVESGNWLRMTGDIVTRIALHAGVDAALIDTTSLAALDNALYVLLPGHGYINLYLTEQASVLDVARRLARPCNAQAGISWLGKLFVVQVAAGAPAITLDAQGHALPLVTQNVEADVSTPYWRIAMGGARSWRVHSADEIATFGPLRDRGAYSATEIYTDGNFVQDQGVNWLWQFDTRASGHAPPTLPATSNAYWSIMGGDVTANTQIAVVAPPPQTFSADYLGVIPSSAFPRVLTPIVTRGGVSIRTDTATTYSIGTPVNVTATINNTGGSVDKGKITVTAMSAVSGWIDLAVTVAGVAQPVQRIPFTRADAEPPTGGTGTGGGTGNKSGSFGPTDQISSTTYVRIGARITVTKATGETIRAYAAPGYQYYVIGGGTKAAALKWRYAVAGTNFASPTDFGSPVTGSTSVADVDNPSPGSVSCNQTAAPANGDYDVELWAALPTSGGGIEFDGTTCSVAVAA